MCKLSKYAKDITAAKDIKNSLLKNIINR